VHVGTTEIGKAIRVYRGCTSLSLHGGCLATPASRSLCLPPLHSPPSLLFPSLPLLSLFHPLFLFLPLLRLSLLVLRSPSSLTTLTPSSSSLLDIYAALLRVPSPTLSSTCHPTFAYPRDTDARFFPRHPAPSIPPIIHVVVLSAGFFYLRRGIYSGLVLHLALRFSLIPSASVQLPLILRRHTCNPRGCTRFLVDERRSLSALSLFSSRHPLGSPSSPTLRGNHPPSPARRMS